MALLSARASWAQPPERDAHPTPTREEVEQDAVAVEEAAPGEPRKRNPSGNVIVPLLMYTPETHFGFGGLFVHFFRLTKDMPQGRVSSLTFIGLYTTRHQAIFEFLPDLYFYSDDLHLSMRAEYQSYPDSFWGIGNDTSDDDEERYERERARFRALGQLRVYRSLHAGLGADVMQYDAQYSDPDGVFATQEIPGEAGGFTAGVGPNFTLDSRDNAVATHDGTLIHLAGLWFGPAFGSRYTFHKISLDARQFFPVSATHTLALRFYAETQGGDVPYYHLAMLGGDELLRGYYLGRYRDKNLSALEAEYRLPLFWRFGGVAFGGVGQVSSALEELPAAPVRWTVGGGLRYSLSDDEPLNLRLDVGVGHHTYGIYFTAREAF